MIFALSWMLAFGDARLRSCELLQKGITPLCRDRPDPARLGRNASCSSGVSDSLDDVSCKSRFSMDRTSPGSNGGVFLSLSPICLLRLCCLTTQNIPLESTSIGSSSGSSPRIRVAKITYSGINLMIAAFREETTGLGG